ncbi:MAG: hypothetical protein FKY71_17820 [Spiribacter salinus]|uniref:Uncharacterized protein n=1 Tax=Spiribacter salinus TaxID=1335746 RepID=A0A540VBG0_9GAMM|nr:MAG: hypothetical protein FKY71_17820 [Spiribacter salinus]
MTKRRPQRFALRVIRHEGGGALIPADSTTQARMRERGYKTGDLIFAEFRKPRNPQFHRLIHAIGGLAANNIDEFHGMSAHSVLKRLQLESGVGCEEIAYKVGDQMVVQRIPLSLSFESMEDGEFKEVSAAICHRLTHYWPDTSSGDILAMAQEHERGSA